MDDIAAEVIAIIAKRVTDKDRKITLSDQLEDLGVDSFGAVEMIFDLEEKFDIHIQYNSNDAKNEFKSVGNVVEAIKRLSTENRR
jgi:acyl carrier protein